MIFPLVGIVFGALYGALAARRRGGKVPDLLQWAAVWAIIMGLAGLFLSILLQRLVMA
ncbi:hypothetical protein ruthe_01636 [Rubellimicrobium thermophilum DSM 16684]|uniref:Uncharacterized protein n=1 Tax=Rubellimicrobium thermophilum DSM 16684 TaxID=1123069 RepID=S9S6U4_9RHOB|nr:hypothetical protein [Rubellimicrobium thermophilum]EPX85915.1 hypothetical protein ruthe_01636 [Rubellimicrobium thermophilum DSM 16684]